MIQKFIKLVADFNLVGTRQRPYRDIHGVFLAKAAIDFSFFLTQFNGGDVSQPHQSAFGFSNNQLLKIGHILQGCVGEQIDPLLAVFTVAKCRNYIVGTQCIAHVF